MKILKPLLVVCVSVVLYLTLSTEDTKPSHQLNEWRSKGSHFLFQTPEESFVIFYRDVHNEASSNNTLLLLHGFPTSSFDFQKILPQLSKMYRRVITPDFLGFGFSDKPSEHTYTMKEQTDIVSSLLVSLNETSVHVIAHDYGVTVGQELLARQKEKGEIKVLSMCFLNGGLFPEMHRPRLIQTLLLNRIIGPILSAFSNYAMFKSGFSQILGPETQYSESELLDAWFIISFNNGHKINHKLINYIPDRKQNRERWVDALQTETPILLINGPYDPVSGAHMVQYYMKNVMREESPSMLMPRKVFPSRDVIVLDDNIGHYPQWESPQEVMNAYSKWIAPAL